MSRREMVATRSFLFTPANHPRRVAKVFHVGADAVILDLEDAVAVAEKEAARSDVVAAFRSAEHNCLHYVRINGVDTGLWEQDLRATVGPCSMVSCSPRSSPRTRCWPSTLCWPPSKPNRDCNRAAWTCCRS